MTADTKWNAEEAWAAHLTDDKLATILMDLAGNIRKLGTRQRAAVLREAARRIERR